MYKYLRTFDLPDHQGWRYLSNSWQRADRDQVRMLAEKKNKDEFDVVNIYFLRMIDSAVEQGRIVGGWRLEAGTDSYVMGTDIRTHFTKANA